MVVTKSFTRGQFTCTVTAGHGTFHTGWTPHFPEIHEWQHEFFDDYHRLINAVATEIGATTGWQPRLIEMPAMSTG